VGNSRRGHHGHSGHTAVLDGAAQIIRNGQPPRQTALAHKKPHPNKTPLAALMAYLKKIMKNNQKN
jgi:hypothetical protein